MSAPSPRLTLDKIDEVLMQDTPVGSYPYELHRACEQLLSMVRGAAHVWTWKNVPDFLKSACADFLSGTIEDNATVIFVPNGCEYKTVVGPAVTLPDGVMYFSVP